MQGPLVPSAPTTQRDLVEMLQFSMQLRVEATSSSLADHRSLDGLGAGVGRCPLADNASP